MARMSRQFAAILLSLAAGASPVSARQSPPVPVTPQELARIWDAEHVSPPSPPLLTHAEVVKRLDAAVQSGGALFRMEKVGDSVEGRSINMLQAGSGAFPVLLWSQMHGDEATATAALFDL